MSSLSRQEKQLIFDYCFGLMAMERKQRAESLISTNREAANIASCVRAAMGKLQPLKSESCPEDLVERTMLRLKDQRASI
jgi:anti-sigma-K factor RskA